jgi:hypothetical protein
MSVPERKLSSHLELAQAPGPHLEVWWSLQAPAYTLVAHCARIDRFVAAFMRQGAQTFSTCFSTTAA